MLASNRTFGSKSIYLHTTQGHYKHSWANKYLFDYKDVDKDSLIKLVTTNIIDNDES